MLTVAATHYIGGMDDVALQSLGNQAAGEGGRQGGASMAEYVPGAGVGELGEAAARGEAHSTCRTDRDPAVAAHVPGVSL